MEETKKSPPRRPERSETLPPAQNFARRPNLRSKMVQNHPKTEKIQIIEDLKLIEKAGVFAIVIECTLESLVNKLIEIKKVPLIGIGASKECEEQILVTEDIIRITKFRSRFLKKYMNFNSIAKDAISEFSKDVNNYKYPTKKHCYK